MFAVSAFKSLKRANSVNSTDILYILCRACQNIEHFGRIMDHVEILVLVARFMLLNLAQIIGETLLMVCVFLLHQFLRNQAALLMVEQCRRRPA